MRTRSELYSKEAAGLLQTLSQYPGLSETQLCRFYPGREGIVKNLLSHFKRQGRARQDGGNRYFPYAFHGAPEHGLVQAVWVLLDFIGQVEYHSPGTFPSKVIFFAGGKLYEIIYVALGQEPLITQAVRQAPESGSRRIVLVEAREQIPLLDFPSITGFCTVSPTGTVSYYQKQLEPRENVP